MFTDQAWHNTGVAFAARAFATTRIELAPGVFQNVRLSDVGLSAPTVKNDLGRFEISGKPEDRWAYTTPTLRGCSAIDRSPCPSAAAVRTLR